MEIFRNRSQWDSPLTANELIPPKKLKEVFMNYILVFIGGGLGSICRYFISSTVSQYINSVFPIGTFSVNLIGSFLMGFLFYLFQNIIIPIEVRILLTIGFLGEFTTFSSFSVETVNLLRVGENKYFLLNIILTNVVCLFFAIIGIYFAKFFTKTIK